MWCRHRFLPEAVSGAAAGGVRWPWAALVASVAVPALLFLLAVWFDYRRVPNQAAEDARRHHRGSL
jgi:cytochrome c-type biogenesis protein CcmH/NrfG